MNIIQKIHVLGNQYLEGHKLIRLSIVAAISFIYSNVSHANSAWGSPLNSNEYQQLILVVTDDWQADNGYMYTFNKQEVKAEDKQDSIWVKRAPDISKTPVTIGKKGLAWGIGLHPKQKGIYKAEGDGKAPAGIFSLGNAFGYLENILTGLTYQPMTKNDFCIDVKGSPYYNQLVNSSIVGDDGVKGSTEAMRRDIHYKGDQRYRKGIFVKHNESNVNAAGSCIFMHVWKNEGIPTSGCTAMTEQNMDSILAWLQADKKPLYVALPMAQYQLLKAKWKLPDLTGY